MEKKIRFGEVTVSAILENALGDSEKAGKILSEIQSAIDEEKLSGEDLKKRIYDLLCSYGVNDLDVYHILLRAPQVIPPPSPHVIPANQ